MAINTLEKNSFFKYFEILKDKFFKIILLNSIYFTAITLVIFVIMGLSAAVTAIFGEVSDIWTLFTFLPISFLGPLTATITKLMRDFVRQEPGFFFEDFKKAFKENFKQSIIISVLQYIAMWIVIVAIRFYYSLQGQGIFYTIGLGVAIFVLFAIIFASYYVYMMIVTLDLKIYEIIKNSFIFTMLCFLKNVLLTIILGIWLVFNAFLVYLAVISGKSLVYGLVISVFIVLTFGIVFYTVAFFTFPSIKKYILDPYYKDHPEKSSESIIEKDNIFEEQKEQPEFVYHNGRMIHRSALDAEAVFSDEMNKNDD